MLSDISRQTRLSILVQSLSYGLMLGSLLAFGQDAVEVGVVLVAVGFTVMTGWLVGFTVWVRRTDRALRAVLVRGSEELVSGEVSGVRAPGRVVRRRIARHAPAYLLGTPTAVPGASLTVVATALAPDGARRVAALVPGDVGLTLRHAPVGLVLHPDLPDVAVLDPSLTVFEREAVATDPRWSSGRLPSDRSVIGGYLPLLGAAILGLAIGVGVDGLVTLLAV